MTPALISPGVSPRSRQASSLFVDAARFSACQRTQTTTSPCLPSPCSHSWIAVVYMRNISIFAPWFFIRAFSICHKPAFLAPCSSFRMHQHVQTTSNGVSWVHISRNPTFFFCSRTLFRLLPRPHLEASAHRRRQGLILAGSIIHSLLSTLSGLRFSPCNYPAYRDGLWSPP